ncbi:MAG: UvrD-helicase domain-containing protein [Betaproteobacteria bacterium]|uniref:ATP-dependent helicase n=1 Tax=Thiomonas TaxID=32012 RepID=UPI002386545D|nr:MULTISPECIES: UvrD-helicase domain-containing protein [Thiomonas]MDE2174468.1 UvrD-helicase domain-containing protein [Betaproteobacteria bacterium]HML81273.1 UvrD-helicase domain-containing protein [Thiomonas arsenitoxydans]
MLNAAQERAVAHLSGPCLVIAGAGSGKTRVITHKIGRLLRAGLEPDQIAAITFTNKAAAEMRERAAQLVDKRGVASKLAISTFHALGVRMLRESGQALGLKPKFSILAADDVTGLLRDAGATTDNAQARRWQWTISLWKNAMLTPEAAARVAENDDERVAAKVYARYADMLQAYQAVDFDDLIWLPVTLLQQHADVREHWQSKLRYLLVDEYQDTNAAQYDLLRLLVGDKGRFTAVGDDDQSIYGWRGATLDNLRRLQTDWPTLEVIKLEQNYRSTNAILRAANAIIQSNPKLYPKSLWSEHGEGEAVEVRAAQNEDEEAQMVAARIQALRSGRNAELAHIAVLYRANHQSRPLEQALRRANIPYVVSGGQSFFDRAEIKDVCAYLRLLANPDDDPAFLRAVTTPRRGVGPQTLAALSTFAGQWKVSMFEALFRDSMPAAVGARPADHLREFGRLLHDIEWRARTAPAGELLREMLETIGFRAWLEEHSDNPREAEQRWKNVDDFCGWIERKAEEDKVGLTQIAQTISLITQLQERGDQRDAVTLCTLHAAKGLEWPHVVLAGCEEGLLPFFTDDRPLTDSTLEEERRLMYVGVTRARQTLVLSWCQKRKQGRGAAGRSPSRFIGEMQTGQPKTSNKDAAMARIAALRSRLGAAAAEQSAAAAAEAKP